MELILRCGGLEGKKTYSETLMYIVLSATIGDEFT